MERQRFREPGQEIVELIDVPGVGNKEIFPYPGVGVRGVVHLSPEEVGALKDWPFTDIGISTGRVINGHKVTIEYKFDVGWMPEGAVRAQAVKDRLTEEFASLQQEGCPNEKTLNVYGDMALPELQDLFFREPTLWGMDLLTGKPFIAYTALAYRPGETYPWRVEIFENQAAAAASHEAALHKVESIKRSRAIEQRIYNASIDIQLPEQPPAPLSESDYVCSDQQILRMAGIDPNRCVFLEDVRRWNEFPGKTETEALRTDSRPGEGFVEASVVEKARDGKFYIALDGRGSGMWEYTHFGGLGNGIAPPALASMGVPADKIEEIKNIVRERQAEKTRTQYSIFCRYLVRTFASRPEFSYYDDEFREAVNDAKDGKSPYQMDGSKIRDSWSRAVYLYREVASNNVQVNFSHGFRLQGGSGWKDAYVIAADGFVRDPDIETRKGKGLEGTKRWHIVDTDDVIIQWSKLSERHQSSVQTSRPTDAMTSAQRQAMQRLLHELGARFYEEMEPIATTSQPTSRGEDRVAKPTVKKTTAESTREPPAPIFYAETELRKTKQEAESIMTQGRKKHLLSQLATLQHVFDYILQSSEAKSPLTERLAPLRKKIRNGREDVEKLRNDLSSATQMRNFTERVTALTLLTERYAEEWAFIVQVPRNWMSRYQGALSLVESTIRENGVDNEDRLYRNIRPKLIRLATSDTSDSEVATKIEDLVYDSV